jgi:hypothetical protein
MRARLTRRLSLAFCIGFLLSACAGGSSSPASPSLLAELPAIKESVVSATSHPSETLEILAGPAHLRLSISDATLAKADQAARETAATDIVTAMEKAMESRPEFAAIQEISVAIVHPAEAGEPARDFHIEDVVQFRKGPNQRFIPHIS